MFCVFAYIYIYADGFGYCGGSGVLKSSGTTRCAGHLDATPLWSGRGSGPPPDPSPTTMSKIRCYYSYYIDYSSCDQTTGRTNVEAGGLIATAFMYLNLYIRIFKTWWRGLYGDRRGARLHALEGCRLAWRGSGPPSDAPPNVMSKMRFYYYYHIVLAVVTKPPVAQTWKPAG